MSWKHAVAAWHRYTGAALCLIFAVWFATGVVMLFVPFPGLSEAERFACLSVIDLTRTLTDVLADPLPASVSRLRLTTVGGRPALHVTERDAVSSRWADSHGGPVQLDAPLAMQVAAGCGLGTPVSALAIGDDQWTVHQSFAVHRPLWQVNLDDAQGTVVYVSSATGGVVQKTTRRARAWNWVGSVPHWIYPTVIRRHWELWDRLVWWLSGLGTTGVAAGIVIGLIRWRQSAARAVSPFRGALYWHHVTGLGLGLVVLSWILSGMLSMDHGRLFSTGAVTAEQAATLAGAAPFAGHPAVLGAYLDSTSAIREIEWLRVDGRRFVAFRTGPGAQQIVPVDQAHAPVTVTLAPAVFAHVQSKLVEGARLLDARVFDRYDVDYYGREHAPRPLPILRLRYDDLASTWLHVDMRTGTLLERVDASRRAYRYWYNALHSHDLPWMLEHMTLRRSWMTLLCVAGFAFSLNGVWLAWRWLQRAAEQRPRDTGRSATSDQQSVRH